MQTKQHLHVTNVYIPSCLLILYIPPWTVHIPPTMSGCTSLCIATRAYLRAFSLPHPPTGIYLLFLAGHVVEQR